jgi:hypothetical protein
MLRHAACAFLTALSGRATIWGFEKVQVLCLLRKANNIKSFKRLTW